MTGKRHGFHARWRVGFDDDGRLQALDATLTSDGGWSLDLSEPVLARALCHVDNAYWIPNVRVNGRIAKTNKTSQTAFRGFGGPQGMLVIEDILGRCAPLLGVDAGRPAPPQLLPSTARPRRTASRCATPNACASAWEQVLDSSDFAARPREIDAFNAAHEHTKRGLAITPVKFGISFNFTAFNQAGALVHVYKDGSVLINHGGTEMGQGLHTKMLQVAATTLGRAAGAGPARADPHRQGAQHLGHRGELRRRPQRRRGQERLRADPEPAGPGGGRPARINASDLRFADGWVYGLAVAGERVSWEEIVRDAYFQRVQLWAAGFYRTEGLHWDSSVMQGVAVQVLRLRRRGRRGRGRRLHRRLPAAAGRHRARRRRQPLAAGRPRPDRGRLRAGRRLADPRGPALGRERRPAPRPAGHPGGQHLQAAELLRDAGGLQRRACWRTRHEDGAVYGSKAVGEPPLMLAFSVREALRQAAAAFGPPGTSVDLASPATPEAVYWAVEQARRAAEHGHVDEGAPGRGTRPARPARTADGAVLRAGPAQPDPDLMRHAWRGWKRWRRCARNAGRACWSRSPPSAGTPRARPARRWSSPRTATWGTIGGGNLEAAATARARELLDEPAHGEPELRTIAPVGQGPSQHGVQCCGGEVTVLLEPLPVVPAVAIFGVGHVGLELARILARHDLDLHLVDSRTAQHRPGTRWRCSPTRSPACTSTTSRCCPSWCWPSCRPAPTC